jgi:DNA-binding transcriptional MerR regulator
MRVSVFSYGADGHTHTHARTHAHARARTHTHIVQYLVDLHSYIDHLEDQNGLLHADIKLALAQVQEHHMKGLSESQMQEQMQVMHEEIQRLQQSEALLARQVSSFSTLLPFSSLCCRECSLQVECGK